MAPNIALMAAVLGGAMCLHAAGSRFVPRATTLACVAVLLLGGATLAQYVLSVDLGIERLPSGASEGCRAFQGARLRRPRSPWSCWRARSSRGGPVAAGRSAWRPCSRGPQSPPWRGTLLSYLLGVQYVYDGFTPFRMGVPSLASLALTNIAVFDRQASHAERDGADGALLVFDSAATSSPCWSRGGLPEAQTLAAALLGAIRDARLAPADSGVTVTASTGIATFEGRAEAGGILVDADLAIYEAERAGGDRSAHRAAAQPAPGHALGDVPGDVANGVR
jgi:hypothetical protein